MKLSDIDVNLLVVLDAIISERSVTGAGRRIGLSQPATSASLRRLRALFGDPLLERVGPHWRLTTFARELAEPLQESIAALDATLNRRFVFDPTQSERRFGVAAADDVGCVLLKPLLEALEHSAPRVKVLIVGPDAETRSRLMKRQLDLSIVPDGFRSRGFLTETLYTDSWVVAAWSGNPKLGRRLTREQLLELGHMTVATRPYAFTILDRALGALAQKLDVQVVAESFTALALLLRGSQRIALIPGRLATALQASADLRILPAPLPLNELVFAMAWPALYARDQGHAWFRKQIAEAASRLVPLEALAESS